MRAPEPAATDQGGSPGVGRESRESARDRSSWGELALGIAAIVAEELVRRWLRGRRGGARGGGRGRRS